MRWGNGFLIHIRKDNMYIIYIYTNTHTYVHAYTHIHINIHTCMHTRTYAPPPPYKHIHTMSEPLLLPSPVKPTVNAPPGCLPVLLQRYHQYHNTWANLKKYIKHMVKTCNQRIEVEGFSYNSIFLIV
jgi:hypothetical protein